MKNRNINPLLHALLPVAAVIIYVILGYCFKGRGWAVGWIVFLFIPIIESAFTAFKTKNPSAFVYPVLVTAVFLAIGLGFGIWHPTWVLFVTIPAFYAVCDYVNKNNVNADNRGMPSPPPFQPSEGAQTLEPNVPPYVQNAYTQPKKSNAAAIIISVIFSITAIVIAAIIAFFSFLKGGIGEFAVISSFFSDNGDYTEINTFAEFDAERLNSIDIDWVSGNVNIEYYDGKTIYVEENGGENSFPLCYKIDGGTLKINEYHKKIFSRIKSSEVKDLTVKIPLTFKAEDIEIAVVSANVSATGLNVTKLDFETVSGNGRFEFAVPPAKIDVESVSGDADVVLPSDVSGFNVSRETASGSFSARDFGNSSYFGDGYTSIKVESVSGNLTLMKAEAKTVAA